MELAASNMDTEIRESILQILLQHYIHLVGIKGGESGRIGDIGILSQVIQLHMTGRVSATAQLFRHLASGQSQFRAQGIEHTALTNAGIARKGNQSSPDELTKLLYALTGFRAGADHRESGIPVDSGKIQRRVQVALVDADIHRHLSVTGDCRHPVDQKWFCHRIHIGSKHHQPVHIGNGRPYKAVLSWQDPLHHALALFHGDLNQIPC